MVQATHSTDADLPVLGIARDGGHGSAGAIRTWANEPITVADRALAEVVARARPVPLRAFDQIPMRTNDLARQGKLAARLMDGRRIAFVGDMDGTASLLGLIAASGGPAPAAMLLLDFDERVIDAARSLAERHGFGNLLTVRRYNCFEPIPPELVGSVDWFYANPPYGSRNEGESARLFLTRGCELVGPEQGSGCLILLDDPARPWTRRAMLATHRFLDGHGWRIREQVDLLHRYHLDDDPDLASSLVVVDRVAGGSESPMPFAGRPVGAGEIPDFYGRTTRPPYPRSIDANGASVGAVAA